MSLISNNRPILKIDLEAVKRNYLIAKCLVNSNVNCSAVIKANAYGLGSQEIFQALSEVGCTDFYLIYLDEALKLCSLIKPNHKIYLIAPLSPKEMKESLKNNFIPVLSSKNEIQIFRSVISKFKGNTRCVLHIDTGMNRLGMNSNEINAQEVKNLPVKYVMSHMACADQQNHSMNDLQLKEFEQIKNKFCDIKFSLSNSAALFLNSKYHCDQIRIGMMLYGMNPLLNSKATNIMSDVVTIEAKVVAKRLLKKDSTVSYGATFRCTKHTWTATIAIGYADGYPRSLSNNTYCYAFGKKLPILGKITMDFTMIDISSLDSNEIKLLEYVEVMGKNIKLDELACRANTISYEILTSLQNRFNRFYI